MKRRGTVRSSAIAVDSLPIALVADYRNTARRHSSTLDLPQYRCPELYHVLRAQFTGGYLRRDC